MEYPGISWKAGFHPMPTTYIRERAWRDLAPFCSRAELRLYIFVAQSASVLWTCIFLLISPTFNMCDSFNTNSPKWRRKRRPCWTRAQTTGRRTPCSPRNRTRSRTGPLRQEANCHLTHTESLVCVMTIIKISTLFSESILQNLKLYTLLILRNS